MIAEEIHNKPNEYIKHWLVEDYYTPIEYPKQTIEYIPNDI